MMISMRAQNCEGTGPERCRVGIALLSLAAVHEPIWRDAHAARPASVGTAPSHFMREGRPSTAPSPPNVLRGLTPTGLQFDRAVVGEADTGDCVEESILPLADRIELVEPLVADIELADDRF